MPIMPRADRVFLLLLMLVCCHGFNATGVMSAAEWGIDHAMYQDPELRTPPWKTVFSDKLKPLWLEALARPDAETRRLAADSFSMAIAGGMPNTEDIAGKLQEVLANDPDPVVRRAVARTLIVMRATDAAPALVAAAKKDGLLMAQLVEPAIAQWQPDLMQPVWLSRLEDRKTERRLLLLAIDAQAVQRNPQAKGPLTTLMLERASPPELRLAAAKALGEIHESGLVEQAQQLIGAAADQENLSHAEYLGRLLAVSLLSRHQDEATLKLLESLATDREPAIAAAALGRLHALQPTRSLPFGPGAIASRDARLRRLGVEILNSAPSEEVVRQLAPLLNDRNPGVREQVAQSFVEFAKSESLKDIVLEQTVQMLAGDEWRSLEQAALVLGHLDHEPAADRLIALMNHARGEVAVTAAWSLRKLQVAATLPQLLQQAQAMDELEFSGTSVTFQSRQLTQLFQAFGQQRYKEAEALMRKYVPKSLVIDTEARAAACWALGYLYENQPETDLVTQFIARAGDVGIPPEYPLVRRMSSIALGRMKAQQALDSLRKYLDMDTVRTMPGLADAWAIEQLTGETIEKLPFMTRESNGWFLESLE